MQGDAAIPGSPGDNRAKGGEIRRGRQTNGTAGEHQGALGRHDVGRGRGRGAAHQRWGGHHAGGGGGGVRGDQERQIRGPAQLLVLHSRDGGQGHLCYCVRCSLWLK